MDLLWKMTGWIYNWAERLWWNILVIWLEKYMLRPSLDLWLDVKTLQLYRTIDLEYIKEISNIEYKRENYDNKAGYKYKAKDKSCGRIGKYFIKDLEDYNIQ